MPATPEHSELRNKIPPPTHSTPSVIFWILTAIISFAPLPLGSNRPLPAALAAAATGILLLCSSSLSLSTSQGKPQRQPKPIQLAQLLVGLVCVWIFFQSTSITTSTIVDPIWATAGPLLNRSGLGSISINPNSSITGLMHLLTYVGVFYLSYQLGRDIKLANRALQIVSLIGTIYCSYGLIVYLLGNDTILIFRKWAYQASLTSTFVNRNNFATFAGLSLLCSLAYLLTSLKPVLQQNRRGREMLVLVLEQLLVRARWYLAATILTSMALLLTTSRGGVASSLCAAAFLVFLVTGRRRRKNSNIIFLIMAGTALSALSIAFVVAGQGLAQRIVHPGFEASADSRLSIYSITADGIWSAPWTGVGFGTYQDAITAYMRSDMSPLLVWDKAHNTYLENTFELGIPGAMLLFASIFILGAVSLRGVQNRRRNVHIPAIGAAATALIGLHSLVDFSMQIPAVAMLFAYIIGNATAQCSPSARTAKEKSFSS